MLESIFSGADTGIRGACEQVRGYLGLRLVDVCVYLTYQDPLVAVSLNDAICSTVEAVLHMVRNWAVSLHRCSKRLVLGILVFVKRGMLNWLEHVVRVPLRGSQVLKDTRDRGHAESVGA